MFRNSAHPQFILLCPVNLHVNVTVVRESCLYGTMFILLEKINTCISEMCQGSGIQDLQILVHI